MRSVLLFVCALALLASVSAAPCWDYRCSGSTYYGGLANQIIYSAFGQRSQPVYIGGNYDNGGLFGGSFGYSGSFGYGGGGGQGTGGGGYGNNRQRNCPTCGISNFGNGDHNVNKITIITNYG
ncbi:hypothetical protein KGM_215313 [Danaus plexippus plexippus]|uniref:Uncharacterized protein n=1 Tax=Danaus plexippus plexippus TaxID=278856 RepID=A0A212EW87_DANPL|nr:hypothetical protein KGM_215313 [Danaus plexippus plexippus]